MSVKGQMSHFAWRCARPEKHDRHRIDGDGYYGPGGYICDGDVDGTYDPAFRWLLASNDQAAVTYEWDRVGAAVALYRKVTRKAHTKRDRVILWQEAQVIVPITGLPNMVADLMTEVTR